LRRRRRRGHERRDPPPQRRRAALSGALPVRGTGDDATNRGGPCLSLAHDPAPNARAPGAWRSRGTDATRNHDRTHPGASMTQFELPEAPRLLLQADLKPVQGHRFQPTGFPDIGAGVYTLPNGEEHLLVESAQSVANRLEAACWDDAKNDLVSELQGLPYVRVGGPGGEPPTPSLQEAHRANAPDIEKTEFFEKQLKPAIDFDDKKPADRDKLIRALCRYDVGCLLHGVFLESIAGVLRVPRALSGFIEASRVTRVNTGGVKNDRVQ